MPTIMQRGAEWLGTRLKQAAGVEIVYARGSTESAAITATVARHDYEVIQDDGSILMVTSYDWTFTTADMLIGVNPIAARSGDRISGTLNGQAVQFEVTPIGKRPCVENIDPAGILSLVHSKKVAVDA